MEEKRKSSTQDRMKWFMLAIASLTFSTAAFAKLFNPTTEISTVANVFLVVCGLVLGASVANYFKKDQ